MTDEERTELADKLNDIWTVLRHVSPRDLPTELAAKFDGSYADAALEAARYIRQPTQRSRSPRRRGLDLDSPFADDFQGNRG